MTLEKKYADAIAALAEVILEQRSDVKMKDWEIENLKAKLKQTQTGAHVEKSVEK